MCIKSNNKFIDNLTLQNVLSSLNRLDSHVAGCIDWIKERFKKLKRVSNDEKHLVNTVRFKLGEFAPCKYAN